MKDDGDLLEELVAVINKIDGPYDYFSPSIKGFLNKVELIKKQGFEENPDAYFLAMWVREKLSESTYHSRQLQSSGASNRYTK